MKKIERPIVGILLDHLTKGPNLLQMVVGPRQVGKTFALKQVISKWKGPSHYASADLPIAPDAYWIESQWQSARQFLKKKKGTVLLVLDEVQKVPRWSEVVKALFDEDRHKRYPLRTVLLGSAALKIQSEAGDSLAGRFERLYCSHWSWKECQRAFGWVLDQWLYYGGYPRAAQLIESQQRWSSHIVDSLIDSVLSRDVLQMTPIVKPALLRQLFMLSVHTPAQILSYNKMLGQLQDAGNTVTLAHYLNLLSSAFLVTGLQKWSQGLARSRASSPKLIVWNNALITSLASLPYDQYRQRRELWGRLVENAVGAHLLNHSSPSVGVYYWRHRNDEVDFILEKGRNLLLIEVKSGLPKTSKGLDQLKKFVPKAKALIVGTGGVPLEQFFSSEPTDWF